MPRQVLGLVLRGRAGAGKGGGQEWVTSYTVSCTVDPPEHPEQSWEDVDAGRVFVGSSGCDGTVEAAFATPVRAMRCRL